jgi:DNA helicase-2/ATP-dependent DNA helicase PcrA
MEGKSQPVTNLKSFKALIISLEACIESSKLKDLVDIVIEETGYLEMLKNDMDTYHDRYSNLKEFRTVLKEADEFYEGTNRDKLELLLQDLSLRTNNDDSKNDEGIILSTYHQVKGLEFNNVFMVAMEEEIFPSVNSMYPSELEEERRVCYVGITRAKNKLYITNCKSRFLFGSHRCLEPSRFVKEMDKTLFKNITKGYSEFGSPSTTRSKLEIVSNRDDNNSVVNQKVEFAVGDKISHKAFGDGLVVAVKGEIISVAFKAPFGIKHLMGNHPAIAKINS